MEKRIKEDEIEGTTGGQEKKKYRIMSLYRLPVAGTRGCSSIRFSSVPTRQPHNQRTIRVVSSLFLDILGDHRWPLMKVYCTFCHGLHIAFSDDWIENRSSTIALLETDVTTKRMSESALGTWKDVFHRLVPSRFSHCYRRFPCFFYQLPSFPATSISKPNTRKPVYLVRSSRKRSFLPREGINK